MLLAWVRGILFGVTCALFLGTGQDVLAQDLASADPTGDAKTSAYRSPILTLSPEELYARSKFGDTVKQRAEAFATNWHKKMTVLRPHSYKKKKI